MTEEEIREKAARRVKEKKGFYAHLVSYVIVISFLAILNLLTSPGVFWFIYPALGWGVGLAFHYFAVFGILRQDTDDWEKRELEKEIRRLKRLKKSSSGDEDYLDLESEKMDLRQLKKQRTDWDERDLV